MSIYAAAPTGSDWSLYRYQSYSTVDLSLGRPSHTPLGSNYGRSHVSNVEGRPILRSHRSFPHAIGPSSFSTTNYQSPLSQVINPDVTRQHSASIYDHGRSKPDHVVTTIETTFGGSAPTSPVSHLSHFSPVSPKVEQDDGLDDDDEMLVGVGDLDEDGGESGPPKTAAERRAEKRKMKRFRLTHNQTRFLMSEFARQAHPDAAQRERLSREIPGLTPRQVQVWFQNRRAKLKRLTSDDRERMMKSRALPEDFDMTQTLHSPFGSLPQPYSTPLASPSSYTSTFAEGGMIRPLLIDEFRRQSEDDATISPISMGSTYGNLYTPPGSIPASENLSPISPVSERFNPMSSSISQTSPRGTNPFRSNSFSALYAPQHIPKLHSHERVSRTRAESLASPLRSSMSYSANLLDYGGSQSLEASTSSQPAQWDSQKCDHLGTTNMPYSSAFSGGMPQGFQSSVLARPRPTITTFPPGLDIRSQYRPFLPTTTCNQAQSPQGFQSAPLAAPQDFQLPHLGGSYHPSTTPTGYTAHYGQSDTYGRQDSSNSGRIIEEQAEDQYSSQGSTNSLMQANESCTDDAATDSNSLQHSFHGIRRQSFTDSANYRAGL